MKTVIEMAREAGMAVIDDQYSLLPFLERLVELARADEREKYKWDIHSCGPSCKRYACVATREAIAAEREAFPDLTAVINWLENGCDPKEAAKELRLYAAAIRARGNT